MISQLKVENFKSLKSVDLPLENLNVLFGANNSGKSSILQALVLLSETYGGRAATKINVNPQHYGFDLGDENQIFFRRGEEPETSFEIVPKVPLHQYEKFNLIEDVKEGTDFEDIYLRDCWIGFRLESRDWEPIYQAAGESGEFLIERDDGGAKLPRTEDTVDAEIRGYLDVSLSENSNRAEVLKTVQDITHDVLEQIYYISEKRMVEDWKADPKQHDFVGPKGDNTIAMLRALMGTSTYGDVIAVAEDLAPDISTVDTPIYDTDARIEVMDEDTGSDIDLAASGSGLRRSLPIILQAIASNPRDTILIEEPEISLYPVSQEVLARLLVKRAAAGVQLIVTTHSPYFVNNLHKEMNKEGLDSQETTAYRVRKEDGKTQVDDVGIESAMNQMQDLVVSS